MKIFQNSENRILGNKKSSHRSMNFVELWEFEKNEFRFILKIDGLKIEIIYIGENLWNIIFGW